ncbi:porin family protein [Pricia sp.]|uniref:porin family protein n=1 Tax=Pricia sp. TaxID=2268138 RepID=UPI0035948F06
MKGKFFAIIAMVFFGSAQVYAQVIQGSSSSGSIGEIGFGAKAGLNFTTFLGNDFVDISPKLGAYVGGMAEIPAFFENFYFQPELLLSFQGADIGAGNLNLSYLNLPLMAKYHITEGIAAEFGPQIGVRLSDNGDDFGGFETNSTQIGLNFGGGYRLNDHFYFQLRIGLGLSKVRKNTDLRNGVVSLGGAYFF